MRKLTTLALFLAFGQLVFAQKKEPAERPPETFTVGFLQDNAFGFLPTVAGSFPMSEKWSFTFYGNFWTNPFYGTPSSAGNDIWLESGIGASTLTANDRLLLNPTLGLTHGKLLHGGPDGVFGDGLVPALTLFYKDRQFELEAWGSFYKSLRRKTGANSSDFILYWLYPGVFLKKNVSLGLHYEQFYLSRTTLGEAQSLYHMMGGYVKFTIDERYWMRFSAGKNFVERSVGGYSPEFYRLGFGAVLK